MRARRRRRRHRGAIARWTLVQTTAGLLLQGMQALASKSRAGRVAIELVPRLAGASWSVATFFVIPLLAFEGLGPRAAVQRSVIMVRERLGGAVVGSGAITLAVLIAGVIPAAVLVGVAVAVGGTALPAVLITIAVLLAIGAAVTGPALSAILRVILYRGEDGAIVFEAAHRDRVAV